jgi:hypothetical protein
MYHNLWTPLRKKFQQFSKINGWKIEDKLIRNVMLILFNFSRNSLKDKMNVSIPIQYPLKLNYLLESFCGTKYFLVETYG